MRSFLNPWVILGLLVLLGGTATASYLRGRHDENIAVLAAQGKQRSLEEIIETGIAKGVSRMKVQNTTIRQNLETLTRESVVYRDCKLDPAAFGLLNSALTGQAPVAAGNRVVPTPISPDR